MQLILRQDTTAPLSIATLDANNKYLEAISLASNNSMIYISSANNPIGSTLSLPFPSSGRFSGKFITGSNDGLFLSNGNQLYLQFNSIDASNVNQYVLWQTLFDNPTGKVLSVSQLGQNAIVRQKSWKFRINSITDNAFGTYSSWILDASVLSGVNGSTFSASSKYLISWQDSSTGYGVTGPAGVTGPQGPQGPGVTSILNNTFTSLDTITITHSLGYYPVVQVLNDVYEEIIPVSITHNTVNDFTIILDEVASGLVIAGAGGQGSMGPAGVTGSDGPNSIRLIFGASASGSPSATGSFNISGGLSFSAANFLHFNSSGFLTNDIYGNVLYPWLGNILTDREANKTINAQISEVGNPSNYGIYIAYPNTPSPSWMWDLTFVSGGGTFSSDKIYTISAVSSGAQGPTGPGGLSIATQSVPTYSGATGQYGETRLGLSGSTPYLYVYTDQWYQFMGATF